MNFSPKASWEGINKRFRLSIRRISVTFACLSKHREVFILMEKETFNEKRQQKEEMKSGILCTTLQNNTGKVIFEDNNLCCQFLNDYVDLPHFKDVRSEDIEDVSEEFVPLFSNEREADRIKEIKIRGESNITSFFLISLIEHKSNVEYNIHMQIFRYMVYIWERYERRMEPVSYTHLTLPTICSV